MEAAAKLGISVTISKVGIDLTAEATANVTSNERNNDWQPAYTLDEGGLLLQLRTTLVQTLDSMCACILAVSKQSPPVFALYWDKKPQFFSEEVLEEKRSKLAMNT